MKTLLLLYLHPGRPTAAAADAELERLHVYMPLLLINPGRPTADEEYLRISIFSSSNQVSHQLEQLLTLPTPSLHPCRFCKGRNIRG
jgi:hypothetical protein